MNVLCLTFIYGSYFTWNKHWQFSFITYDRTMTTNIIHNKKCKRFGLRKRTNRNHNKCHLRTVSVHHYPACLRHDKLSSINPQLTKLWTPTAQFEGTTFLFEAIMDKSLTVVLGDCASVSLSASVVCFHPKLSLKLWTCNSSLICPFREPPQWRNEALSRHRFTAKLKYNRK